MCRTGEARAERAEYRRQTEGVHSAGTGRRSRATGGPGRRHGVGRPRGCRTDDGPLIRFATGRTAGRRGAAAVAVRRRAARSLQEPGGDGTDAEQYRDGTGQCGTGTAFERCPLADQPPEGIRTGPDETIHALLLCGSGHLHMTPEQLPPRTRPRPLNPEPAAFHWSQAPLNLPTAVVRIHPILMTFRNFCCTQWQGCGRGARRSFRRAPTGPRGRCRLRLAPNTRKRGPDELGDPMVYRLLVRIRERRRAWQLSFDTDWRAGSTMTLVQDGLTVADPEQVVLEADPYRGWPTRGIRSRPSGPPTSTSATRTSPPSPTSRGPGSPSISSRRGLGQTHRGARRLRSREQGHHQHQSGMAAYSRH